MRAKLGQHFLSSGQIAKKIADLANLSKNDAVLEIGPGKGILTEHLLEKAGKVIAVEKDERLSRFLKEKFSGAKNFKLINADIRDVLKNPTSYKLKAKSYKVVANIPYYLTSFLFRLLLEKSRIKPEKIVVMIQKEVAQRICAKPPQINLLALSILAYGKPKIAFFVKKGSFSPPPKVDSAVLVIDDISSDFFEKNKIKEKDFFEFLRLGFSHKRKTLTNNLAKKYGKSEIKNVLRDCDLNKNIRPQNLFLKDWRYIYGKINK
ncbi:MAG: ribosomal RNA small subunit methyltransferase A [Candidatus Niyogibacteria bacterium RIFCSPLOWO2_12_FULL_41_13]|uniref:Ribosomal RNA small subunit methyltransferase A n=1 Tax=Candidatus Niyogibacteria bacterium RIFCSPLOWO2_12_FULL_41_13 TaxID=1801726 RepID=A0A1G2F2D3_9BACT|nr:MAG: ribosomal RNA small subunit methyltransferase A [Candidatus Niyogibacteria bacterium RIFCSPLOWO2_12_FULL_41_13]